MMNLALFAHLASAVIWIGGMFFAYLCLRPATLRLDPPQRLSLWADVLAKFFPWVWTAVLLLPVTGYWMLLKLGGFAAVGPHVHLMQTLGIVMILIFLHLFFAPFARLKKAVTAEQWPAAATHLSRIRVLVAVNLTLGLLILLIVRILR